MVLFKGNKKGKKETKAEEKNRPSIQTCGFKIIKFAAYMQSFPIKKLGQNRKGHFA